LSIWRPKADPIAIAAVAPRLGDMLTIAGYGQGRFRAANGRCTQYVAPAMNLPYEMVEVAVTARQGDSGGPILNERGELAGVLFGSSAAPTTGSYCGRVREFLAAAWPDVDRINIRADEPQIPRARIASPTPSVEDGSLQAITQEDRSLQPIAQAEAALDRHDVAATEPSQERAASRPAIDLSPPSLAWRTGCGSPGKLAASKGKPCWPALDC